jgi:hypothetical protein
MTPSSLAVILYAVRAILEDMVPEVRNRCADTTHLRLQGVIQSLDTAASLAVAAPAPAPAAPAPAPAPAAPSPGAAPPAPDLVAIDPSTLSTLIEVLGDRIAIEVRAAMDAAKAQDQAQAQG